MPINRIKMFILLIFFFYVLDILAIVSGAKEFSWTILRRSEKRYITELII